MSILLDGDTTNGQLGMVRTRGSGGAAAPVHVHSREDEVFLVLEGSGIFWVGDQREEVSAGGVAFLPRGLPHAYRVTSDYIDLITLCAPAGIEFFSNPPHKAVSPGCGPGDGDAMCYFR